MKILSEEIEKAVGNKLNSTALSPDFSASQTYFVGETVTYNGVFYKCVVAKTAASATTPDNDIYDATSAPTNHWKITDLTTPDATLDITSAGALRVVAADGTILWMQGYDLESQSTSTLKNEAVSRYDFPANSVDKVYLTLPNVPSGKVGDFVLDVTVPALSSPTEFSQSSTYAQGAVVAYDGQMYVCTTAVETAGEWTGSANWEEAYPSFGITGLNSSISIVIQEGKTLDDILTFTPGIILELHFTLTAFSINELPTWKIVRQDLKNGGAA